MNLPAIVRSTTAPVSTAPVQDGRRHELPLGTADWLILPDGRRPGFKVGDFLLSYLPDGKPVGFRDDRHVLVVCGTRGGKGISVLVPNLLLWPGSALIIDPKGENAMVTARRRAGGSSYARGMGQRVYVLDPFHEVRTPEDDFTDLRACFNPLDLIDPTQPHSIDIAARIAEALIISEGTAEPVWEDSARIFLQGLILHVASSPDFQPYERNLGTVRRLILAGDELAREIAVLNATDGRAPSGMALLLDAMRRNHSFGGEVSAIGAMLADQERTSPRTFQGVAMAARSNTNFIGSHGMRACLSRSDFRLSDLKSDPRGVSIYLCLSQRYMESHARWLRMMVTLTLGEVEGVTTPASSPHPTLMVLDEFASLKRMKAVENAAAQIAGSGVKMTFVVQTLGQLKDIYKDNWETIVANCGIKLFFCNDDQFTRDYASKLAGECETSRWARSWSETNTRSNSYSFSKTRGSSVSSTSGYTSSGGMSGGSVNSSSGTNSSVTYSSFNSTTETKSQSFSHAETNGRSEVVQKRFLITPDEVGRLFGNRDNPTALVLLSGYQPLCLRRIPYFQDPALAGAYDRHARHAPPLRRDQLPAFHKANTGERRRQRHAARVARIETHLRSLNRSVAAMREDRWRRQRQRELKARKDGKQTRLGAGIVAGLLVLLAALEIIGFSKSGFF